MFGFVTPKTRRIFEWRSIMTSVNNIDAASTVRSASRSDSSDTLLKSLRERHPDLQISAGAVAAGSMPAHGDGYNNVLIDPRYLKKMASDPETAKKGEEMINGIPAAQEWLKSRVAAMGGTLVGGGTVIDMNGGMSSWSVVQSSSDSRGSSVVSGLKRDEDDKGAKRSSKTAQSAAEKARDELERLLAEKAKTRTEAARADNDGHMNVLA